MKCPICNKPVKNARGVSMHMSMRHKDEWATGAYSTKRTRQRALQQASKLVSKWEKDPIEAPTPTAPETPETTVNRTLLTVIHTLLKGYEL